MMDYKNKILAITSNLNEAIRHLENASTMGYSAEFKATIEDAENYIEYAFNSIRLLQRKDL